jgi:hypothetical protein
MPARRFASLLLIGLSTVLAACDDGGSDTSEDGGGGDGAGGPSATSGGPTSGATGSSSTGSGDGGAGGEGAGPASSYTPNRWVTVDATGDGDGSEASPWTIQQAMANAAAGDVVQIAPGTYTVSHETPDEIYPALYPANSGTEASPIVFFAQHRATQLDGVADNALRTELRHTAPDNSGGRAIFGCHGTDYATWDGFYVDAEHAKNGTDSGMIRFQMATGCKAHHNEIQGRTFSLSSNATAYRTEDVYGSHFSYNRVRGIRNIPNNDTGTPQYAFVTMTYADQDFVIEHNEISDSDNGIFTKGGSVNFPGNWNWGTIRFNRVQGPDMNQGMRLMSTDPVTPLEVYQNVIFDCTTGTTFAIAVDPAAEGNIRYHHNTVARCSGSGLYMKDLSGAGGEIRDNIFALSAGATVLIDAGERTSPWNLLADHNVYLMAGSGPRWSYDGAEYSSIDAWRSAIGEEQNSQVADPQFVDPASADFRLQAGSPALTASSTAGAVGAYVDGDEIIGID